MRVVLGLDTSNYTTSVSAVCLETGAVIAEERMLLPVAAGDVGLRQSDAVFHHLKQLPTLMDRLVGQVVSRVGRPNWSGVGVSVRPRPLAASYMPVFQVGRAFAYSIARTHSVPLICTPPGRPPRSCRRRHDHVGTGSMYRGSLIWGHV